MWRSFRRYLGMSVRAATVVTLAAIVIFTAFGSFHWRLWWLVPPVWLVLFALSLLLAPVMGIEPGEKWTGRLPWLGLVAVSLASLAGIILGIEAVWTRVTLALLAATGFTAGIYGARSPGGRPALLGPDRRRNLALRARTDELLEAIRRMHRVALEMDQGGVGRDEAHRQLNEIEERLRRLLAELRQSTSPPADKQTEA